MKRLGLVLALFASTAALAAPAGGGFGFSRTSTITTTASTVTVPACANTGAHVQHLKVRAPATNSDLIYVRADGTATSADLSITPGTSEEVAMSGASVSVVSASGTQAVDLISSCKG